MSMSQRVLVLVKPTTDAKCGVRLEGPGAVVTKVTPDSLAAAAGVLVGDRLVSVNGVPIDNFETVSFELRELQSSDSGAAVAARAAPRAVSAALRGHGDLACRLPSESRAQVHPLRRPVGGSASAVRMEAMSEPLDCGPR